TARAASAGNQFGIANSTTRTKQPLIVRLQAPRFFVVGDEVTISAVINNNTDEPLQVTWELLPGLTYAESGSMSPVVTVPAQGEQRIDRRCHVLHAGEVKMKAT